MKKYRDLYKEEKRQHEEVLQGYQDNHMNEMEIINLHERFNKTDTKAAAKTGEKAASKAPRGGYHLFLREQLDKITGEDRKNYRSIVSRRWKEIKEDPARLSVYNDRARQMKNEADNSQHEKNSGREVYSKTAPKSNKNSRVY